jgi:transcriptional regulator with GAF, ATPase, and Fis domain
MAEAWFHFAGSDRSLGDLVWSSLADNGIQLRKLEESANDTNGILCFSTITDELFEMLREIRHKWSGRILALAASTAAVSVGLSWRLLHAGAAEVLTWDAEGLAARQASARLERWRIVDELADSAREFLIGDSLAWRAVIRRVVEAARFSSTPILLVGESGTGKELLARLVRSVDSRHRNGKVVGADTVTVDCSTLAPELSGSELFGHERGAFTGAVISREGAFALADGGTLFLDEIGELPLGLQAQLLRAVQEKTYKRVGGNVWQTSDFRLVCATNRDLEELVRRGQFRLDLYHRLAGWVLRTPPLRERRDDIIPLATHFLRKAGVSDDIPKFDPAARQYLLNRNYPGNVRELLQLVQRIAQLHVGPGAISAADIPEEDRPPGGEIMRAWPDENLERALADAVTMGITLREISQVTTDIAIRIAIHMENGNLQRAARLLGVTDRALQLRRAAERKPS